MTVIYGNKSWKVTTDPTVEPLTVANIKEYARIDGSYEDTLIEMFITAVRQATENYLGRALIQQSITLSMNNFSNYQQLDFLPLYLLSSSGDAVIELPRPRLISVTEIRTLDEDGTETTYSSDYYYVRTVPEPGQVVIKNGYTPPINTDRYYGGYEIEFKAGYGTAASDVPANIRVGMMDIVKDVYENRVAVNDIPKLVQNIISSERILPI